MQNVEDLFKEYKLRAGNSGSNIQQLELEQARIAEQLVQVEIECAKKVAATKSECDEKVAAMAQELKEARKLVAAQPQYAGAACLDTPAFDLLSAYNSKAPCTVEIFAAYDSVEKDVIASINELAKTCKGNLDYVRRFSCRRSQPARRQRAALT
jgi:hypothetical protein